MPGTGRNLQGASRMKARATLGTTHSIWDPYSPSCIARLPCKQKESDPPCPLWSCPSSWFNSQEKETETRSHGLEGEGEEEEEDWRII